MASYELQKVAHLIKKVAQAGL